MKLPISNIKVLKVLKFFILCDHNNAKISLKDDITVTAAPATQVAFNNCVPFTKWVTKIDRTKIDYAEGLDLVMPMYNLIEYS